MTKTSAEKELDFWRDGKLGKGGGNGQPSVLFAQVREDAAVEASLFRAVKTKGKQNVFAIASGGCTVLSLATVKECKVHAIDINPAQIYLCLLKTAALTRLSFGEAQLCIIQGAQPYFEKISDLLPSEARDFFLENTDLLRSPLNNCGITDQRLRQLMSLFYLAVHTKEQTRQFLSLPTPEAQREQFVKMWRNWQWDFALNIVFSKAFLSMGFGGDALNSLPSNFSSVMKARLERVLSEVPVWNNGYVWQTFLGEYPRNSKSEAIEASLPLYLQASNQSMLKQNLARVQFSVDDAVSFLADQKDSTIDMFALSNILEISKSDYSIKLAEEVSRTARKGALICLRSIFPKDMPVLRDLNGSLEYKAGLSAEMEALDRSSFCNFIQVYEKH